MDSDTDYDNEYSDAEVDASFEEHEEFYDNDDYCSDDENVFDNENENNFSENNCANDCYNDSDYETSECNQHFQWDGDPEENYDYENDTDSEDDSDDEEQITPANLEEMRLLSRNVWMFNLMHGQMGLNNG